MDRDRDPYRHERRKDDRYPPAQAHSGSAGPSRYNSYEYSHRQQPVGSRSTERSPPPQWSGSNSSRHYAAPAPHHPPPNYPTHHYSYPYPPSRQAHADGGAPPPPPPSGWGQWVSPYTGAPIYHASSPAGSVPRLHPAPPARSTPSPPPPASPSQIQRPQPPPPASAPSPPRSGDSTPPAGYLPGFQPDYDRAQPGETRRPPSSVPTSGDASGSGTASAVYGTEVKPPPTEAYLIIRPHRVPRTGWGTAEAQQQYDSTGWTYELEVLQGPERGKALGVEQLRRGWPPLTPPLIVQLNVKDREGNVIPTDNPALARRLVHLTMSVELVSPDGAESRSMIRVRPPSPRGNAQPYYPSSAPPPYSLQRTLLGSSVRTAQILTREGRKGLYFIFQDMIVRPEGRYALEGKILDLAGPPHIGTSIGVTHPLAKCHTAPFDVIIPQEFPGPVPITALSAEFLRQGERHLGRRPRNEDGETDEAEDTTIP